MRPAPRNDLCGGGTDRRTILTVRQGFQVFLFAFGQQMRTMGRTGVARSLAIRAGFGTRLHHRIVFHVIRLLFLRLPLLGERYQTDDAEDHRQHTDTAEHSSLHGKIPFL